MSDEAFVQPDFKTLFESVPGLYLVLDPALRIVAASDAYLQARLTGRAGIVGRHLFEVFPDNPDDPSADAIRNTRASLKRVLQEHVVDAMGVQRHDVRRPESEGGGFALRYWSPVNSPVLNPDGSLAYILHQVENVTEFVLLKQQQGVEQEKLSGALRERAVQTEADPQFQSREVADSVEEVLAGVGGLLKEQQRIGRCLRQSEERFRATFEQAAVGIAHVAADGRWLRMNQKLCDIVGYSRQELLGLTFQDITHPDDLAGDLRQVRRMLAGEIATYSLEKRYLRKDGSPLWIRLTVALVRDENGAPDYFISVVEDICRRKEGEAEILRLNANLERRVEARTEALRLANRELAKRAEEVADLYNHAPCGYHSLDGEGRVISINDTELGWLGYAREEVVGRMRFEQIIAPHSRPVFESNFPQFKARGCIEGLEFDLLRKDGSTFPVLLSATAVRDQAGNFVHSRTTVFDMTERKRIEDQLRIAAVAFQSRDGMMVTDSRGVILQVNRSFTEVTGYSAAEAVGHTPAMLRSGRHDAGFYRTLWEAVRREGYWQGKIWNRRKDGGVYPEWLAISAIRDAGGQITQYFGEFSDISEPREAERKIIELAFYDPLTGLPNRRLLLDRLQQALGSSTRNEQFGALLLLDLDHFKTLNDTRGHEAGDLLLIEVGQCLRETLRETDTAARLGGDEFVVLLENMGREELSAATHAEMIAEKLRLALGQPWFVKERVCHIGASIGITIFQDVAESVESLLKQADLALYQAKDAGRNTIRFYNPAMQFAVDARAALEAGLHRALAEDELVLFYQAQVDVEGQLIGAEALVRWQPPGRAMVSPAAFIPVAEQCGLILPIGNWVLATACRQIAAWAESPATSHLRVAVNISALQFRQADFVAQVRAALTASGAEPSRLKLELTESAVVEDVESIVRTMQTLQALGVGFSMDDFGTGYSSLANLKRLPLEQLKIDQSFVRDIPADPDDCAIARAVIALGQSLHLHVIAEGVETVAQRDFLASQGCLAFQGYLFGRPGLPESLEALARRGMCLPP